MDITTLGAAKKLIADSAIQYSDMSNAPISKVGTIVQYTGATTSSFTQGHFYKSCWNSSEGSYYWEEINFGGSSIQVSTIPTASSSYAGKVYQYIGETTDEYTHGLFYECKQENNAYGWAEVELLTTNRKYYLDSYADYDGAGLEYRWSNSSNNDDYFSWDGDASAVVGTGITFNNHGYFKLKNTFPVNSYINSSPCRATVVAKTSSASYPEKITLFNATNNSSFIVLYSPLLNYNTFETGDFVPLALLAGSNGICNFSYNGASYSIQFPSAGIWLLYANDIYDDPDDPMDLYVSQLDIRASSNHPVYGGFIDSVSGIDPEYYPVDSTKSVTTYVGIDGLIHFKINTISSGGVS